MSNLSACERWLVHYTYIGCQVLCESQPYVLGSRSGYTRKRKRFTEYSLTSRLRSVTYKESKSKYEYKVSRL